MLEKNVHCCESFSRKFTLQVILRVAQKGCTESLLLLREDINKLCTESTRTYICRRLHDETSDGNDGCELRGAVAAAGCCRCCSGPAGQSVRLKGIILQLSGPSEQPCWALTYLGPITLPFFLISPF